MRLSNFILGNMEPFLEQWEVFATGRCWPRAVFGDRPLSTCWRMPRLSILLSGAEMSVYYFVHPH